jgi:hypothetical protein
VHSSETRHDRTSDPDRTTRQDLRIQDRAAECFAEHSGRADVGALGAQRGGKDDDDPHSPIARKEFNRDLVEHLQTSGCTVLYSSHLLGEVEAVADAVAILDGGKIARTGTTDRLRDEVKQIVLSFDSLTEARRPEGLLDFRRHNDHVAIITDQAGRYIQQLSAGGIDHNVVDLSLDEIFEAYVIGRAHDWPDYSPSALVSA